MRIRESEIQRALTLIEDSASAGRGAIVFLAGSEASGRSEVLNGIAGELRSRIRSPRVVAGGMVDGQYFPADQDPAQLNQSIEVAERSLGLAGAAVPLLGLIGQVLSLGRTMVDPTPRPSGAPAPATLAKLRGLLRRAANEGPLVCLIDDCDANDGFWWTELLQGFAAEIARDLPLFLFLSLDGGIEPGARTDNEADALTAARSLVGQGLAGWWHLGSIMTADLKALTGPIEPALLEELSALAEGRAGWATALWEDWRAGGIVVRDSDLGPWRFAPGQPVASPGSIADVMQRRLRSRLGSASGVGEDAWRLLALGAREGPTFTAEAVAAALRRDRDAVIDLLDDHLSEGSGAIVAETSPAVLPGNGGEVILWRYRFVSPGFRSVLLRYGLPSHESARLTLALANALEHLFRDHTDLVAGKLARLYGSAGAPERARVYRERARWNVPADVMVERAQELLADDWTNWGVVERLRATEILLRAADALDDAAVWVDAGEFAGRAAELAEQTGDRNHQARAAKMQGMAALSTSTQEVARGHFERAIAIAAASNQTAIQASSLTFLARLSSDRRSTALDLLDEAIALSRQLGDAEGQGNSHVLAANLYLDDRDESSALSRLELAQGLANSSGAPRLQANVQHLRGDLEIVRGNARLGVTYFRKAERFYVDAGDEGARQRLMVHLAVALKELGEYDEGRGVLTEVARKAQAADDVRLEAEVRRVLGELERKASRPADARREFEESLRLYRSQRDKHNTPRIERWLEILEREGPGQT